MKLTLEFPKEKWLLYAAWFLIPLAVRSIPELLTHYPTGFDTPLYMYAAKLYAKELPSFAWDVRVDVGWYHWYGWRPFLQILGLVCRSGVDMILFMKVFPTVLFAASIFVLLLYVYKRLKWRTYSTLIACILLSVSPVMLRMSSDLHRQSFALLIFFVSLFFIDPWKGRRSMVIMFFLSLLTGMIHEFVFVVLEAILLYNAVFSGVKRDKRAFGYYALLSLIPIVAYLMVRLLFPISLEAYPLFPLPSPPAWWVTLDWWLSVLILAYGLIIPLSALGAFNHHHLTPWISLTLMGYASVIVTPFFSIDLPGRWLFLAAPPLTIYAANAVAKFRKNLKVVVAIALVSVQAVSMLGLLPEPLSVYAGQHYLCFTDTLLVSATNDQTVDAVREVAAWLNANAPADAVIGAPYNVYGWGLYYTEGRLFIRCDTPGYASSLARSNGYSPFYFIWHTVDLIPEEYRPVYHYYPLTLYQLV